MSHPAPPHPSGYATIGQAADILGCKPWDVVRLVEEERVESVQLVSVESLKRHQAQGAA